MSLEEYISIQCDGLPTVSEQQACASKLIQLDCLRYPTDPRNRYCNHYTTYLQGKPTIGKALQTIQTGFPILQYNVASLPDTPGTTPSMYGSNTNPPGGNEALAYNSSFSSGFLSRPGCPQLYRARGQPGMCLGGGGGGSSGFGGTVVGAKGYLRPRLLQPGTSFQGSCPVGQVKSGDACINSIYQGSVCKPMTPYTGGDCDMRNPPMIPPENANNLICAGCTDSNFAYLT